MLLAQSLPQDAQQILQQLFQAFVNVFTNSVYSPALLGLVVFIISLWFFHEFREWRLSISVIVSLALTVLLMIAFTPIAHLFG